MLNINNCINTMETHINGKWVPAKPINHKYRSLFERIADAWAVLVGRADAIKWPEGQYIDVYHCCIIKTIGGCHGQKH